MSDAEQKEHAIPHIVYEYANLVSAGELLASQHPYSINTHIQDAYLLSCRKMAEFFPNPARNPRPQKFAEDVRADDFVAGFSCDLPTWETWRKRMNQRLAHLSYSRIANQEKPWTGKANHLMLVEFRKAWKDFYSQLDTSHREEFDRQIAEKKKSPGFGGLDLK